MNAAGRFPPRFLLLLLAGFAAFTVHAADDVRFSATLSPAQRASSGLAQLTPDNVAVIDGLVRQDEAASHFKNNAVDGTRFTQRRTDRERELAGLNHLSPSQQAQLDALVRRRIVGPEAEPAPTGSVSTSSGTAASGINAVAYKRPLEIHGEVSYTMGWSKGGSFQGGGMVLTYDDPEHRYSVMVGYSEYHGKGLSRCFYPGGGPYRPYDAIPSLAP